MRRSTAIMGMFEADTQTGENLQFENCFGGYFSDKDEYGLKVVGKTTQNILSGKNLLDYTKATARNSSQSLTVIDNGVEWTGDYHFKIPVSLEKGTAYTCSYTSTYAGWWTYAYTDGSFDTTNISNGKSATTNSEKEVAYIYIYKNNYLETSTVTFKNIQLEKGTTATAYEPYCGGIPSPNPDYPQSFQCVPKGTKIRCLGRNLLDVENMTNTAATGYIVSKSDNGFVGKMVSWAENSNPGSNYYRQGWIRIPFVSNRKITISFDITYSDPIGCENIQTTYNTAPYLAIVKSGDSLSFLKRQMVVKLNTKKHISVSYEGECQAIQFVCNSCTITVENLKIEVGDGTDVWEPYVFGGEVTTPCDLYTGDIWYPISGKVVRNSDIFIVSGKEKEEVSTWYWTMNQWEQDYSRGGEFCLDFGTYNRIPNYSAYSNYTYGCNFLIPTTRQTIWGTGHKGSCRVAYIPGYSCEFTYPDMLVFNDDGTPNKSESLSNFRNWLKQKYDEGDPLVVVHKLRYPKIEQYDPQPIFAPHGFVNVLQEPIDLSATLEATMLVKGGI